MSPSVVSPPLGARVGRRIVSLCMFCEASHHPARTLGEVERWAPLAPTIRAELRDGATGLVVSHGLCPRCARERYPELMS